jgi:hypothetical protein
MSHRYTTAQVADILELPYQTLRSWGDRGFLDFVRIAEDVPHAEVAEIDTPEEGVFVRGRWSRFSTGELYLIGLFSELAVSGVPLSIAAHVADNFRARILLSSPGYLCIARVGELRAVTYGTLDSLQFKDNWFSNKKWKVQWMTPDAELALSRPELQIPGNLLLIDTAKIRQRIDDSIARFDSSKKASSE